MKILFIPHVPNGRIINRVYEFAKATDSYVLDWTIENSSWRQKIASQSISLFRTISLEDRTLRIPLLFKPERIAVRFNTALLNAAIKRYAIDVVVNANALLFDIAEIEVPVVYDLVDDHLSPNADIGLNPQRVEKIKRDIRNSTGVVCVTDMLERKVAPLHPLHTVVENGLYLERFQQATSLKHRLGLEGKRVFGYIGGVDEWTGIARACAAFVEMRSDTDAMIVVGESKSRFFRDLKRRYQQQILFIGAVPPDEVADYFKTIDIGLIPFDLNDFTHHAYPIKALEYGLGGASVLSTPLRLLQSKKLPFITFCEIDRFAQKMRTMVKKRVEYDFSDLSWAQKSRALLSFIDQVVSK